MIYEDKKVSFTTYTPLLTDFYQLTMAYGYWRLKQHEDRAVFHLLFRKSPFQGNYALTCGLGSVIDFLQSWQFEASDIDYLASLQTHAGEPLFPQDFLDYLSKMRFQCDIDAMPEGTLAFPHAPILRIEGPLLQCQLLETPLLNIINFQTLIATKATRVCRAAAPHPVIEFGMRRAQGPDGALSASRAAYIGGTCATSNTLAGKLYDIPVRGTHAHSWVSAFDDELSSFTAYADVLPQNCVLLVDTYNTLQGVKNAIQVGQKLRANGDDLIGIRLDSGDLADLSIKARNLLDAAGFTETTILASNTLDEYVIKSLKEQGAKINAWGVGTNLTTAYDQPALDGVYKLSALQNKQGEWLYKLKLSEQDIKISNPGRHQVRRFFYNEKYFIDVIYDLNLGISDTPDAILFDTDQTLKHLNDVDGFVDLLSPLFRNGQLINAPRSIHTIRHEAKNEMDIFESNVGEQTYLVGLEKNLHCLKQTLIKKRRLNESSSSK
ncbi:MAG: nicotinate phosphoribosyltransferase [Gammaproteobacteria bacterium]|nr:nicotinate phosphoribosyltransferase [Gammaproteobacteria bacterium]